MVSWGRVKRFLLVLWLAAFAVQTSEVLAAVAPDQCVEDTGSASDPCPEQCARCVCCARVPSSIAPVLTIAAIEMPADVVPRAPERQLPSAEPHRILHVPKTL